jgi:hypothetical protein
MTASKPATSTSILKQNHKFLRLTIPVTPESIALAAGKLDIPMMIVGS